MSIRINKFEKCLTKKLMSNKTTWLLSRNYSGNNEINYFPLFRLKIKTVYDI